MMSAEVPYSLIEDIDYHLKMYDQARSRSNAAHHLVELFNRVGDLTTYHYDYSYENGTLPWEREDQGA